MFEERKLEWMAPMAGGWGGGGGGGGIGAGDPTITNEGTATDGQVLTANGDGTFTFETPAGGGSSILTPDGLTSITRATDFNVRDYGASGSRKIFHVTSSAGTYTTKNAAGTPITHDFRVGQGCIVPNAGAVAGVTAPDVAKSTVVNVGSAGSTTYTYKAVAIDADGGRSAASSALQTTTGNATLSQTNYNRVEFDLPRNTVALAIYKSDVLQVVLDCVDPVRLGTDVLIGSFTLANNGGSIRLTVNSGHGIQTNDYVTIKTTSAGDTVYDVTAQCTAAGATTLDFSGVAYDGTATTASGYYRRAKMEWADMGSSVPLHALKYLPDQENPPLAHRPASSVWQGQLCQATASGTKYLYRCTRAVGTRMTGAAAPTWTTDPTVPVIDNEVTWQLEPFFVDVDIPAGAQRKTLFAKIATVPTSSTFTLDTAAGADISVNRLLCAHNDALAFKQCVDAAKTFGQNATIRIPGGDYSCYLPATTNTTYWALPGAGFTTQPCFLFLNSSIRDVARPVISIVADAAATIRARTCQNSLLVENLGQHSDHLVNAESRFITLATDGASIIGGEWEWAPWSGGLTEHDGTGSNSYGAGNYWLGDGLSGSSNNAATPAYGMTIRDVRVHWPSTYMGAPIVGGDSTRKRNSKWINCEIYYGGGDGDQTFLPHGDFLFDGCVMETIRRLGSHGFYLNVANDNYRIVNCTFRKVATESAKNCIQIRGSGGDTWTSNITIANNTFENTGPILVGDPTTSNRVHRVAISNCLGTGVVLKMAEARYVTVTGGIYGDITMVEDCQNIKLIGLTADTIDLSSIDMNYDITLDNCTWKTLLGLSNNEGVKVTKGTCIDPYTKVTNLVSGTYEWTAVGGVSGAYYCTNRATAGDPSISSPSGVKVRDAVSLTATSLTAMTEDTWYYGNTEVQTVVHSGTPTGGSFTYSFNGNTTGAITNTTGSPATAATVQTALRLLTGLSACTVSESGSGTNKTFRVAFTGFSGDPPQMTSSVAGQTGGAAATVHATPNPYPGYNTLVVAMGDSNRQDPDANPYGSVWTVTSAAGAIGISMAGTLTDITLDNVYLKTNWNAATTLVTGSLATAMTDVRFNNITTKSGSLSGAFRMWDFGAGALGVRRNIEFNDCYWQMNNRKNEVRVPLRFPMTYGGNVVMRRCRAPFIGSTCDFAGSKGNVTMIDCEWGTNEFIVTVDATNNEVSLQSDQLLGWGLSNIIHTNGMAVRFFPTDATATSGLTHGQIYFLRTENASTVHLTSANAVSDASPVDLTTSTPLRMEVLDMNNALMLTDSVPTGAVLADHVFYSGDSRGNKIHGAKARTMAQLVANADDYKLPLCDWIRCSSDASRNITGFDRDFTGTVGSPILDGVGGEREFLFTNVGAQNIVIVNADAGVNSQTENQILTSTGANITLAANQSVRVFEDRIARCWRTIGA